MKKEKIFLYLFFLLLAAGTLESKASETAAAPKGITSSEAFIKMPLQVLDLIPEITRREMTGYYERDSIWQAQNAFGGISVLEKVTPDYLKVKITDVSTMEIKLLPASKGDDVIVMSIYTLFGDTKQDAGDSQVSFFDSSMQPLPKPEKILKVPQVKDFVEIPKGSLTSLKELEQMVPFPTIVYSANPQNDDLKARLTVGEYMNQDDYKILSLFLKPDIVFLWNGKTFKLKK